MKSGVNPHDDRCSLSYIVWKLTSRVYPGKRYQTTPRIPRSLYNYQVQRVAKHRWRVGSLVENPAIIRNRSKLLRHVPTPGPFTNPETWFWCLSLVLFVKGKTIVNDVPGLTLRHLLNSLLSEKLCQDLVKTRLVHISRCSLVTSTSCRVSWWPREWLWVGINDTNKIREFWFLRFYTVFVFDGVKLLVSLMPSAIANI